MQYGLLEVLVSLAVPEVRLLLRCHGFQGAPGTRRKRETFL